MNVDELRKEIEFGLENLEKVHARIRQFVQQEIDAGVKTSALTYECLGYYNAIEHLLIGFLSFAGSRSPQDLSHIEIHSNPSKHS